MNSGQVEVVHPGPARGLVSSVECWHVAPGGLVFAEAEQPWLMSVILGVEPSLL